SGLETWYLGYDNRNRLTSVRETSDGTTNLLTVTYTYDALDHRVQEDKWKSGVGSTTTRFGWDRDQVWADLNGSNVVQTRYVYGDGTDQLLVRMGAGAAYWVQAARLGSVRDGLDGTGVRDHVEYGAFGAITAEVSAAYGGHVKYTGR